MRPLLICLALSFSLHAADDFPLGPDSKPQDGVAKGTLIKDTHRAAGSSVFPGTGREYTLYLPAGFDKTKPAAFMVFQDGVIYQAPVVFDNLIAKKDIPPLVGVFVRPGVVPAANENALPRFNRSYEYDSITPTYSQFLIDELLPAIEAKHGLKFSTDPNHAAISGNSSGGICAFMVAWHRPDRFRRVFTGVGTYVGIHGADQLPVLVRKFEPKPLRVFLQSGTGDNNLYCGDWWMANQMMERSLTWAGYDVNHAWGEGGHNQKHASQIFPDVMRWLWRDWQTHIEVKANPKGDSKWKGYEVVGEGKWEILRTEARADFMLKSSASGVLYTRESRGRRQDSITEINPASGESSSHMPQEVCFHSFTLGSEGAIFYSYCQTEDDQDDVNAKWYHIIESEQNGKIANVTKTESGTASDMVCLRDGSLIFAAGGDLFRVSEGKTQMVLPHHLGPDIFPHRLAISPDQTQVYGLDQYSSKIGVYQMLSDGSVRFGQKFYQLEPSGLPANVADRGGLCVDTNGWLYVATSLGIQVCDQAGRVNFIIPTPKQPHDVCFGGKDLSELFIACGDAIYKRPTKAKGVVSGQQAPIKPAAPKL